MMNLRRIAVIAAAAGALTGLGLGESRADTVRARFTYTNLMAANLTSPNVTGNVSTVQFHWTRTDTAGPGVDASVAAQFTTYCCELEQNVSANTDYVYTVLSPAQAGWSADKTLAMQMLWADRAGQVNSDDTSCAFQLAVWELCYDTDRNLGTGSFRASAPTAARSIAQGWLDAVSNSNTVNRSLPSLVILSNGSAQDQVTVAFVPAPGPAACTMLGMVMLTARRRRA